MRVPVGHWITGDILEDEPYVMGDMYYLDRLCTWGRKYNVQVWIDLHAAPGSQNGFDNSGRYGNATWASDEENVYRSIKALEELSRHFRQTNSSDVVTGVGLINEPDPMTNLTI